MPLNMKTINGFTQWKTGSVAVMITHAITPQKHLAQSGSSAVNIFKKLCVFTNEPIGEEEIKLQSMNMGQY